MPMSKATIAGIILAVLIGTISGTFLLILDAGRRLLATDREWTLAPRFQDDEYADGFGPTGY